MHASSVPSPTTRQPRYNDNISSCIIWLQNFFIKRLKKRYFRCFFTARRYYKACNMCDSCLSHRCTVSRRLKSLIDRQTFLNVWRLGMKKGKKWNKGVTPTFKCPRSSITNLFHVAKFQRGHVTINEGQIQKWNIKIRNFRPVSGYILERYNKVRR